MQRLHLRVPNRFQRLPPTTLRTCSPRQRLQRTRQGTRPQTQRRILSTLVSHSSSHFDPGTSTPGDGLGRASIRQSREDLQGGPDASKTLSGPRGRLLNLIQEKRPQGLAPLTGVFRTEYRTLPRFLPGDESLKGVTPRAEDKNDVHKECYNSLATLENTKQLARASALKALELNCVHRNVSYGIVMGNRHVEGILIDYYLAVKKARVGEEECRCGRLVLWCIPASAVAEHVVGLT
ncbi:BZ3500_MvSof-1268-A1-R1_Chr5-1g07571 [Microbotryum saponariae]|uniref:BZ3500_MvSof-1268-A1-R1_Chr5-1g07571 protein n=1 Tax=Microbotryum saponariae TaxID=289078 RepID=A0A2X0NCY4_9BASI|nr:BZ3500_MvSof-1268-A1-R1_Chr5-1g07571 [Microbotryum saponariae]SDA05442.1 BZ3501_MvSof-1269-A2-R1_Chr5-2g07395 [Microbotryum saponariae]